MLLVLFNIIDYMVIVNELLNFALKFKTVSTLKKAYLGHEVISQLAGILSFYFKYQKQFSDFFLN